MYRLRKGVPSLGPLITSEGTQFALYAPYAEKLILNLYSRSEQEKPYLQIELLRDKYVTGNIFHVQIVGLTHMVYYTWQVVDTDGNISKELIDPYAKSIAAHPIDINEYRSISIPLTVFDTKRPRIPLSETIIYEVHIGALTKSDSSGVEPHLRGTFGGIIKKLPYLKKLGVTTLELLPVFKWNALSLKQKHPETGKLMEDVWGYNPITFFALEPNFSEDQIPGGEICAFRRMIDAVHQAGMEVILDVVYNHTGEGGEDGNVFHFKILANDHYYKLKENTYLNCSGTGNVMNCSQPIVKQMILDSLRYWVTVMGVDGFRFDLASILGQDEYGKWIHHSVLLDIAQDPILSDVKLIAESWDAKGSYDLGRMPYPFAEWSDYFRDSIRKFVRGDLGLTRTVADCILGKEVYYTDNRKNGLYTVHFITAHDGFTLWDLVSYEYKHNENNGENNRDGHNGNYSMNCGVEGETKDLKINQLRRQQVKNFLAILLLSRGIPMLLMGDEGGRTQLGNNNAYCQDNEVLWMDWERLQYFNEIYMFVSELITFRKKMRHFKGYDRESVTWHGVAYNQPDWSYYSRTLAWEYRSGEGHIYVVINSYTESLYFELPPTYTAWKLLIDTSEECGAFKEHLIREKGFIAKAHSVCVCIEIADKS